MVVDTSTQRSSIAEAPLAQSPQHNSSSWDQTEEDSCSKLVLSPLRRPCQTKLVLKLSRRQPSLAQLHGLGLLQQVVVLDTAAAKRGVLSVGLTAAGNLAGER